MTTPTIGILTPTIGSPELAQCLKSVVEQTVPVTHYLVIDGKEHLEAVHEILHALPSSAHIRSIVLEENVGKGFYGHRVFASCPALMNTDLIAYCDEDNFFDPTHCESLLTTLQTSQKPWVYALRKIVNKDGAFLCYDDCESLGQWPAYAPGQAPYFHIDSSCFLLSRGLAISASPAWYGQWGQDRVFFDYLKRLAPMFACSGRYTVNYRLNGNANSVTEQFFRQGNAVAAQQYPSTFPWRKEFNEHAG